MLDSGLPLSYLMKNMISWGQIFWPQDIKDTEEEYISLKSKLSTSKGGSRKGHNVFTEQGVYMLATILKSVW